jgi:hypothetical protein
MPIGAVGSPSDTYVNHQCAVEAGKVRIIDPADAITELCRWYGRDLVDHNMRRSPNDH